MFRQETPRKQLRNQSAWWTTSLTLLVTCALFNVATSQAQSTSSAAGSVAILIQNPDTTGGRPPYALTDQFGRIQRYIEPSPGIDLSSYVGTKVRVKSDTGTTLLSSQLDLNGASPQLRSLSSQNENSFSQESSQPSAWKGNGRLLTPIETVQFDEALPAPEDDPAAPIMLDDMLPDPDAAVNSMEHSIETKRELLTTDEYQPSDSIAESVEPIVIDELPLDGNLHSDPLSMGDGCESCRQKSGRSYRTKSSYCKDCDQCKKCKGLSCCPASEPGVYGRADYTLWWFDEMYTPPLVTSGTLASQAILGNDGTQVIFGGDLFDDARSGLRLTLGAWLDDQRDFAIEGDYFVTETESIGFQAGDPTGASIIGRPYYNLDTLAEDASLVSFPTLYTGTVSVQARSEFDSFGLRLRTGLCCRELGSGNACGKPGCSSCGPRYGGKATAISRIDFVGGYRYANLDESLAISENVTSLDTTSPGNLLLNERFDTDNEFHGVDLGVVSEWENNRWAVELTSRIAIGSTRQRVRINGSSTTDIGVPLTTYSGGLLALDSNIGDYKRSRFGVLPELSARIGYKITPDLRLSFGYSLMYWANVVRPGDQIDLSIEPALIPPPSAVPVASSHPQFNFYETGFWAHGMNFGVDYRY